ncbi:hypothetical protein ACSTK8_18215 [Vibrio parahaemolyticus]
MKWFDEVTSRHTSVSYLKGMGIPNVLSKVLSVMRASEDAL